MISTISSTSTESRKMSCITTRTRRLGTLGMDSIGIAWTKYWTAADWWGEGVQNPVVRTWVVVLAYYLTDYRYLFL